MTPQRALAGLVAGLALAACASPNPRDAERATPKPALSPSTARSGSAVAVASSCPAGTAAAHVRAVQVYGAVLADLLERDLRDRPITVLYLVDQYSSTNGFFGHDDAASPLPTPSPPVYLSFPAELTACLDGKRLGGLPPIQVVTSHDDARIPRKPRASPEPVPAPVIDAVVVSVSDVPPGDSFTLTAWADFGGGLDGHGGEFEVIAQDGGWKVMRSRQATA